MSSEDDSDDDYDPNDSIADATVTASSHEDDTDVETVDADEERGGNVNQITQNAAVGVEEEEAIYYEEYEPPESVADDEDTAETIADLNSELEDYDPLDFPSFYNSESGGIRMETNEIDMRFPNEDDVIFIGARSFARTSGESEVILIDNDVHNNSIDDTSVMIMDDVGRKTKKQKTSESKESSSDSLSQIDSDNCCIICTEMWTNSDSHHVVSLKCGHLFGKSCIESWLKPSRRNQRCPQCNKPAKKKDIHKIYAKNLRPLDTFEREETLKKAKFWEEKSKKLETELKKVEIKNKLLVEENDQLKLQIINTHSKTDGKRSHKNFNIFSNHFQSQSKFQISHLSDITINEGGSRYHCYFKIMEAMVVNIINCHTNAFFPRYGIKKIPLDNISKCDSLFLHSKPIKGLISSQYDGTLMTISADKTLKISSVISKTVLSTITLSNEPWSVEMIPNSNLICVGLKNGNIELYDKRRANEHLFTINSFADHPTPIASITAIEYRYNQTKRTALMSVHLDSCWICTFKDDSVSNNYSYFKLPLEGKSMSSDFDKKSGYSLISFRPSQKHQRMTHYVLDFNYEEESSNLIPQIVNLLESGREQVQLARSRIHTNPLDDNSVLICAPDDSFNGAMIWDYRLRFKQPINTNQLIYDFEFIDNSNFQKDSLLSCLGEKVIKLYKMY